MPPAIQLGAKGCYWPRTRCTAPLAVSRDEPFGFKTSKSSNRGQSLGRQSAAKGVACGRARWPVLTQTLQPLARAIAEAGMPQLARAPAPSRTVPRDLALLQSGKSRRPDGGYLAM